MKAGSFKSLKGKDFYLCGPESLKTAMIGALKQKGVKHSRIHHERFAFK
jgi:ferredoxin-NADP reductase